MKTRVYITVDTEGAEEKMRGGRIVPPQGYDIRIWGRFKNQREELGIALLMRELEAYGFKGTFFVEALGAAYFGRHALRDVCQAIRGRGHDVQLHVHPVQREPAFLSRGAEPASDQFADYDVPGQVALLREAIDVLASSGVPKEDIVAFRAGNFGASNTTWQALAAAGIPLSSNYNPCYFSKQCRMRLPDEKPGLFEAVPGVWELPISNLRENGGYRHLQITAVSSEEARHYLLETRRLGIREACIVTHSFELAHIDDVASKTGRVNTVNLHRFRDLCRFLHEHANDFEVDTCGALGKRLLRGEERVPAALAARWPRGILRHKARRLVGQAVKQLEARVPVSVPLLDIFA